MFEVLKRRKGETGDTLDWLQRTARRVLRQMEASVVNGPEAEKDWLSLRLGELVAKLEQADSPPEVLALVDEAFARVGEYNAAVTRRFTRQSCEYENLLKLLARTLQWAKDENEADSNCGLAMQKLLERGRATNEVGAMKLRFSECAGYVREEWSGHRKQIEQTLLQLQEELRRIETERQGDTGQNTAPAPPEAAALAQAVDPAPPPEPDPAASPEADDQEDPITGLPGKHLAEQAVARALAEQRPLFAVVTAIDRLASIEERYGESLRDEVLTYFGQEYAQGLSPGDQLFRWGKSSFLVLMERKATKDWICLTMVNQLNIRYKKNVTVNGRSILLNLGSTWKVWSPEEAKTSKDFIKEIATYIRDHGGDL